MSVLSASTFSREGGIQRVTQMILRLLHETWPAVPVDVFSLHDLQSPPGLEKWRPGLETGLFNFQSFASSRVGFTAASLRQLVARRPAFVLCDHAHLSVLPWMARRVVGFRSVSLVYHAELPTLGWLRRRALRSSDLVIAISDFAAAEARRVLGPDCSIAVCHLGLFPEYTEWAEVPLPRPRALVGRRVVLIVGRMAGQARDKGHEALIRSLPEVVRRVPDVLLVVVGQGEDKARLGGLVAQQGLGAHVHFAGLVPDRELPAYYEAAEIFAMPSFGEGFGLVYLEAMYHAKPCVGGNQDAAGEVIVQGETGLLVEPGNVAQLQETLLHLLLDREMASRMGAAGRSRLNRLFSYEQFVARLRPLLEPFVPVSPVSQDIHPPIALI